MSKSRLMAVPVQAAQETVQSKIHFIRGKKVMLDRDLANLYGVSTGVLNQAVRRHIDRFPEEFMFRLNKTETQSWISQFVISNPELKKGVRHYPYAFTQEGVAMLSGVLNSPRAIQANILIMKTFAKLRELIATNELIRLKIEELEKKYERHDRQFKTVFDALRQLIAEPQKPKRRIGFHTG